MAISYNDFLTRPFSGFNRPRDTFPSELDQNVKLDSNSFNKISLKVNLIGDTIEIPCVALSTALSVMSNKKISPFIHKEESLLIPIFKNKRTYCYRNPTIKEAKSANPVLRELFIDTDGADILNWCKGGDTLYYGGKGILFYEDMTPILMMSLVLNKDLDGNYIPIRPVIRINPIVYTNDDLMAKHIRTKFLCNAMDMLELSRVIHVYNSNIVSSDSFKANFKVIIEDFTDEWFDKPIVPNVNVTSEDINSFIANNFTNNDF